jgi:hypothetical protein
MAGESPKAQDIRRQSRILRNALRTTRSTFVPSGSTGWIDDPVVAGVSPARQWVAAGTAASTEMLQPTRLALQQSGSNRPRANCERLAIPRRNRRNRSSVTVAAGVSPAKLVGWQPRTLPGLRAFRGCARAPGFSHCLPAVCGKVRPRESFRSWECAASSHRFQSRSKSRKRREDAHALRRSGSYRTKR